MLDAAMEWLTNLPLTPLYVTIAILAAFENFFPPFPSDGVIAFGSFLVARAHGSLLAAFFFGLIGNVAGASMTYFIARRYGSGLLLRRLERFAGPNAEPRLVDLYNRYGAAALFLSRFLPGVRAIVPPFAGAIKLPAIKVISAITVASALWFGLVTFLAFRAGDNWDQLQRHIARSGKAIGIAAVVAVIVVAVIWYVRRRRSVGGGQS